MHLLCYINMLWVHIQAYDYDQGEMLLMHHKWFSLPLPSLHAIPCYLTTTSHCQAPTSLLLALENYRHVNSSSPASGTPSPAVHTWVIELTTNEELFFSSTSTGRLIFQSGCLLIKNFNHKRPWKIHLQFKYITQ